MTGFNAFPVFNGRAARRFCFVCLFYMSNYFFVFSSRPPSVSVSCVTRRKIECDNYSLNVGLWYIARRFITEQCLYPRRSIAPCSYSASCYNLPGLCVAITAMHGMCTRVLLREWHSDVMRLNKRRQIGTDRELGAPALPPSRAAKPTFANAY